MRKYLIFLLVLFFAMIFSANTYAQFGTETFKTSKGNLKMTFLGHGSLSFEFEGKNIYVDPDGDLEWTNLPKADMIMITHEHGDHLDLEIVKTLSKSSTVYLANANSANRLDKAKVLKNGDKTSELGLNIQAVPAYNIKHMRGVNSPYHPKGTGNGYIITFGDKNVYVGGDTENIPEMKNLKDIEVAVLPMNLPYTMTPEMMADAARMFTPKYLYIYHYKGADIDKLRELMKDVKGVELRVRDIYK
ncbi:MBL fold metallo-hydrolase [candidate division KSB1 bacterium]